MTIEGQHGGEQELTPEQIAALERQETQKILDLANEIQAGYKKPQYNPTTGAVEFVLTEKGQENAHARAEHEERARALFALGYDEQQASAILDTKRIFEWSRRGQEDIIDAGSRIAGSFKNFYDRGGGSQRWPNWNDALTIFIDLASADIEGFQLTDEQKEAIKEDVEQKFRS